MNAVCGLCLRTLRPLGLAGKRNMQTGPHSVYSTSEQGHLSMHFKS
ncbi:hypothetical protein TR2A62_2523 [Thalassobium sp. R2A62]|nr:hypothetical protein TR2A62_2523 [Thalassobium sp. R2A62]